MPSEIPPTGEDLRRLFQVARREAGGLTYHTRDSRGSDCGFPDVVDLPAHGSVAYVEFKSFGEGVSPAQQMWIESLRRAGQSVYVCRPSSAISVAHALGLPQLAPVLADLGCGQEPPEMTPRFDLATATDGQLVAELLRLGVAGQTVDAALEHGQLARRRAMMALYHQALNSKRGG